ncbi:MAG: DUF3240 family protein [Nitrospira sp.]
MKCLTLIVHASAKRDLADRLRNITGVKGFTLLACEGHSAETEHEPFQSVRDRVVGYVPRVRVDILLEDAHTDGVIKALKEAFKTDEKQRARIGIWFMTDILASGKI